MTILVRSCRFGTRSADNPVSLASSCSPIGQIDDEALFYLRQRGISLEDAHILLRQAFAADVFEKIRIPAAKEYINQLISERLKSEI